MKKLKLNKDYGKPVLPHGYELNPKERYVINIQNELKQQLIIMNAVETVGLKALQDYYKWLEDNDLNTQHPNPTNDLVGEYYGNKSLWKTEFSQGIVVKNEKDDDYYIVMECSRKNEGFKYTQIVLTLGGCV